ncbi:MAG: HNH endonuclease [Nanoarchaeota archaeon]
MSKNIWDLPVKIQNPFESQKAPNKNRKPIGKSLRDQVWLKYMGNKAQGKCYCCKIRTMHITDFQVGHNKSVAKGGKNHISNLRPICRTCNLGMRTKSIERYKKEYFSKSTKKKKIRTSKTKESKIK